MNLDEVVDTYEFGWNITRKVLAEKEIYTRETIFGDLIVRRDSGLMRDLEAERLHHKYSKMLHRGERKSYCKGALALIEEWDIIGVCPRELDEEDEDEID